MISYVTIGGSKNDFWMQGVPFNGAGTVDKVVSEKVWKLWIYIIKFFFFAHDESFKFWIGRLDWHSALPLSLWSSIYITISTFTSVRPYGVRRPSPSRRPTSEFPIPVGVWESVANKSCLVCVKSEKYIHFNVSLSPQCRSQAVVCVCTPRM